MTGLEIDKELFDRKYRITKACNTCLRYVRNTGRCILKDVPVDVDGICKNFSRDYEGSKVRGVYVWLEE